jgi:NADH-quinone oxidoreductase subunit J
LLQIPDSIRNPQSAIRNFVMSLFLFWCFALLMLGFGAAVVINRNPVASALSLVVSFLGMAALFMLLDAFFIGVIQVLVYAGAVMVLFLFIIMLLDLRAERLRQINWPAAAGGIAVAIAFLVQMFYVVGEFKSARQTFPALTASKIDDVHNVGRVLFESYNLPFQVVGVLVLVASIGVIVLSARQLR